MSSRPVIIGGLLLVGAWLIYLGGVRWMEHRAASATVDDFLVAVRDGEFETAKSHLSPELQAALKDRPKFAKPFETAIDGLRWEVSDIEIDGATAAAQLRIEKDGFSVTPVLEMVRTGDGVWKISRIKNLFVDPAWEKGKRDQARLQGEQTAEEIRRALRDNKRADTPKVGLRNGNSQD